MKPKAEAPPTLAMATNLISEQLRKVKVQMQEENQKTSLLQGEVNDLDDMSGVRGIGKEPHVMGTLTGEGIVNNEHISILSWAKAIVSYK